MKNQINQPTAKKIPLTKKTMIDRFDKHNTSFLSHKSSRVISSVLETEEQLQDLEPKKPNYQIAELSILA